MTDRRTAALAEARERLHRAYLAASGDKREAIWQEILLNDRREAAATGGGWCWHEAEIARLRRIEGAAQALMTPHTLTTTIPPRGEPTASWTWLEWDALRAALERLEP